MRIRARSLLLFAAAITVASPATVRAEERAKQAPADETHAVVEKGSKVSLEYTLCADWDDRWRTGGTVEEVVEEAHLDIGHVIQGIERFVRERDERLARVESMLSAARAR